MSMALDQIATTLMWLSLFGPLLLAGLLVAMDPAGFRGGFHATVEAIRRFQAQFRMPWQVPSLPAEPVGPAPRVDAALRLLGAAVVAAALVALLEVLR